MRHTSERGHPVRAKQNLWIIDERLTFHIVRFIGPRRTRLILGPESDDDQRGRTIVALAENPESLSEKIIFSDENRKEPPAQFDRL
jgi:hypothetical protein